MAKKLLTDDQVKWAWRKKCEGHTTKDIAKALLVNEETISRYFADTYFKTKPGNDELIPLVYEEKEKKHD